ncbi:MAG: hypothetical protein IPP38_01940 [Bacteroidetes bacterium]|nr:hypothetical protein [Bacteroidota bacterium]
MLHSLPFHDNFDSTGIWTVQHSGGSSWEQGVLEFRIHINRAFTIKLPGY